MSKKGTIRMITPQKEISAYRGEEIGKDQIKLAKLLDYTGSKCIVDARTKGSYQDRTGNLRNSIGYVVLMNGQVYSQNITHPDTQSLIAELIPQFQTGIVLIVAAGMNYSGYVEAKGYNVITSSRLYAQEAVPRLLTQIGFTKL